MLSSLGLHIHPFRRLLLSSNDPYPFMLYIHLQFLQDFAEFTNDLYEFRQSAGFEFSQEYSDLFGRIKIFRALIDD
jgi:hypothetical protein